MILYTIILTVFGFIVLGIYLVKYRKLPLDVWIPNVAWIRALIYFLLCNIFSAITGTLEVIITQPIATTEQIGDPYWILFCVACFIYIFFGYWILWARMTLTFERKFYFGSEIIFGLIWGWSTGQILLSFYHLFSMIVMPVWVLYLCSYSCMGIWQYFIQDYFWDIYVSPEHDSPKSIIIKTLFSHIPNVAICLGFLITYNNYLIFVLTQCFALIATSIFQKFPAPWAKGSFHAPMTKPGLFGIPHGAGYQEKCDN